MSVTTEAVAAWLTRYIDIWKSGEHARVAELFSDDAVYHADPFSAPRRGLADIAELWRIMGDPPDAFAATYAPLAITGDLAVATGFSRYFDNSRTHVEREYGNIFVLRFAPDGRCSEYREWYMPREETLRLTSDPGGRAVATGTNPRCRGAHRPDRWRCRQGRPPPGLPARDRSPRGSAALSSRR